MFQKSVINRFSQDEVLVATRWAEYQKYKEKIYFIKTVKEEKYQDGFLKDIFENCLGYTLDSTDPSNFNLERELKNETDSKKADAVIYVDKKVVGIVELKAQDTKNLDKIEIQAFNYHNSHSNSKYIVISNFDELRFYIDKKTAYEKFSLFNLSYDDFKKLHLLLSYESIKDDIPLKIKEKSTTFEQDISKELYKDFSIFRTHIFENLLKNNANTDKSLLLRLTQKLCDRIIFILFAEDRGLLSANTIQQIRERHSSDIVGLGMYEYYKIYFEAINTGNDKLNIPKYNGGLFTKDDELDSLVIDDNILDEEVQKLSNYDFESDVSVNILGHIFEQSLTDLEELQANIDDTEFDKTKTKRKKDGVFYTPAYITKYIVDNTLGKLCDERKIDLSSKKDYEEYLNWLLLLKVLDPACGSGAFLNQAFTTLKDEYTFAIDNINEFTKQEQLKTANKKGQVKLFDATTKEDDYKYFENIQPDLAILENNLYGVDINEDAVEIAKLSLWLRTAQKGRPLTKLADKIKCGNSLIDDKNIADNAFVWQEEFKEVFEQGGFDVVIGNPPYIMEDDNSSAFIGLHNLECYQGKTDIWHLFTCKGIDLLKENGLISYIAKNQWLNSASASNMREKIYTYTNIKLIIDFGTNMIFENVGQQTMIYILKKDLANREHNIKFIKFLKKINSNEIQSILFQDENNENVETSIKTIIKEYDAISNLTFSSNDKEDILLKMDNKKNFEFDNKKEIIQGVIGGPDKAFVIKDTEFNNFNSKEQSLLKMFHTNTGNYYTPNTNQYIFYLSKDIQINTIAYPNLYNKLLEYKEKLENRRETLKGSIKWYHLWWARNKDFFEAGEKLVWAKRTEGKKFTYTTNSLYGTANLFFIKSKRVNLKYVTALLNSKLYYFYMNERLKHTGELLQIDKNQFMKIPLFVKTECNSITNIVDNILTSKEKIAKYKKHFDSLNAVDKIEIKEEMEKLENDIKIAIDTIDKMVYELYGLSEDEIKIVEGV